jgi:hypothetical protein
VSREELIARKDAIRTELARTHRTIERLRVEIETASGLRQRFLKRRLAQLEARADTLMSEEHRLRQLIDRSR